MRQHKLPWNNLAIILGDVETVPLRFENEKPVEWKFTDDNEFMQVPWTKTSFAESFSNSH